MVPPSGLYGQSDANTILSRGKNSKPALVAGSAVKTAVSALLEIIQHAFLQALAQRHVVRVRAGPDAALQHRHDAAEMVADDDFKSG